MERFPLRAVRELFFKRQHLRRPRALRLTARSLEAFVTDVGGLQLDTINVLERAHYLTAWSRFGEYDRPALDRLIYRRKVLFEYWAHAACYVPRGDLRAWVHVMRSFPIKGKPEWRRWLKKHGDMVRAVEDRVRAEGPLGSVDFEHVRKGRGQGWWDHKPSSRALQYLWMTGRFVVQDRVNFHKRYDLAGRVFPELLELQPSGAEEFVRWHIRKSLRGMGAATDADLRMYLTYPWKLPSDRKRGLGELLSSGEVVEISVEGNHPGGPRRRWFAASGDLPALRSAARSRGCPSGATFLSPFDSLLWHRERIQSLFGFEYKIQVYTPGPDRVHGYYTMPILVDGALVGRIDAKNHRKERRLEALHVHYEGAGAAKSGGHYEAPPTDRVLQGTAESLVSLAKFLGAGKIELRKVTPGKLRTPLGARIRALSADTVTSVLRAPA